MVEVFESAGLTVARFALGAVVVRSTPPTILELSEAAAIALDVLLDRPLSSPHDEDALRRARDALPLVRCEVFDDRAGPSRRAISVDDHGGRPLIRRHREPTGWARAAPHPSKRVSVDAALARVEGGALLVIGKPFARQPLVDALERSGVDAVDSSRVDLYARPNELVACTGDPSAAMRLREIWDARALPSPSLHLSRVRHSEALAELLHASTASAGGATLDLLARASVAAPFFRVGYPRDAAVLRACVRTFPSLKTS